MGAFTSNRVSLTSIIDRSCYQLMWQRKQVYALYREYEKLLVRNKCNKMKIDYNMFKQYLNYIGIEIIPETEDTLLHFYFTYVSRDFDGIINFTRFARGIGLLLYCNNDAVIPISYELWNQGDDNFNSNLLVAYLKKLKLNDAAKFIEDRSTESISYDEYYNIVKNYWKTL